MLDIYDASIALRGISRSLAIITHAFLHDGEVRHRADHVVGARIYVHPPMRGSYDQLVSVLISQQSLVDLSVGVAGAAFWDVAKWTYGKVIGRDDQPTTPAGRRMAERIEPTMGELSDVLEQPVRDMHRPIQEDPEIAMDLIRPRVGQIVTFDSGTLDYISQVVADEDDILISGNVTRYNILSGYGRLYDDRLDQTVPFEVVRAMPRAKRVLLTQSLNEAQRANGGKVLLMVSATRDGVGDPVKYFVKDVMMPQEQDEGRVA